VLYSLNLLMNFVLLRLTLVFPSFIRLSLSSGPSLESALFSSRSLLLPIMVEIPRNGFLLHSSLSRNGQMVGLSVLVFFKPPMDFRHQEW
jgi:hypothetical protein